MKFRGIVVGAALLMGLGCSASVAQTAETSYKADPDTYKMIFEDQNFRVIAATWKKGTTDQPHSHPVPSVAYALNDCLIRVHNPDGTTREINNKAGGITTVPITASHTAENVGGSDCQVIFVERK